MANTDCDREPTNPRIDTEQPKTRRKGRTTAAPLVTLAGALGFASIATTEAVAKVVVEVLTRCALEHHADRTLGAVLVLAVLAGVAALAWLTIGQFDRRAGQVVDGDD